MGDPWEEIIAKCEGLNVFIVGPLIEEVERLREEVAALRTDPPDKS